MILGLTDSLILTIRHSGRITSLSSKYGSGVDPDASIWQLYF